MELEHERREVSSDQRRGKIGKDAGTSEISHVEFW